MLQYMPGITELLIILGVLIVIFGASRLPKLGRGLGEGMRGFRDALRGADDEEPEKELKEGEAVPESDPKAQPPDSVDENPNGE